jgi:hypothetical protein
LSDTQPRLTPPLANLACLLACRPVPAVVVPIAESRAVQPILARSSVEPRK